MRDDPGRGFRCVDIEREKLHRRRNSEDAGFPPPSISEKERAQLFQGVGGGGGINFDMYDDIKVSVKGAKTSEMMDDFRSLQGCWPLPPMECNQVVERRCCRK